MIKKIPVLMLCIVVVWGSRHLSAYGDGLMKTVENQDQIVMEEETTGECIRELQPERVENRREYSICLLVGLIGLSIPMIILLIASPKGKKERRNKNGS